VSVVLLVALPRFPPRLAEPEAEDFALFEI
jgi:hypothetical protein